MVLRAASTSQVLARCIQALFDVKPREIGALTGLRGFAALWVVALHLSLQLNPTGGAAGLSDHLARAGYLGVDLFFVLSGFVIADNYRQFFGRWGFSAYWRFLFVRLGRIYPVHFVMLLATLAAVLLAANVGRQLETGGVDYSPQAFVANLLLAQGWGWPQLSWNAVAWTISAEWFAYLLFPLVARTLFGRLTSRAARVLAIVLAYGVMLASLASVGFLAATSELGLLRVAAGFSAGVVVWLWTRDDLLSDKACFMAAAIGIAGLLATILLMPATALADQALWPVPWFVLLVLGLTADRGPFARLLSSPLAIALGRVSYSLYMVHVWVIFSVRTFLASRLDAATQGLAVAVLAPVASVGVATLMFLVIEEPFRKRARAFARREERRVS